MIVMKEKIIEAIKELKCLYQNKEIVFENEIALQIELIIILRRILGKKYHIYPEKNIRSFNLSGYDFIKKEIDITILGEGKYAIELKFPRQGQYPEQMFKVCEDIRFLEQLRENGFAENYFIMFTDLPNFYSNIGGGLIYNKFRRDKVLSGEIIKPTGAKDKIIKLNGNYNIEWKNFQDELKFIKVIV
jgi:hypothetical protein